MSSTTAAASCAALRAFTMTAAPPSDPSYTRVAQIFRNADFIWTKTLKLDNLVLARFTAKGPAR